MRNSIVVILFGILTACSSDPLPVLPPMQLEPVENALRIHQQWATDIGTGVENQHLRFQPVWENDTYYTVDYRGYLYAVAVNSGDIIWQKKYDQHISAGLNETAQALFFATEDGQLYSVSKKNGAINWQTRLSSEILSEVLVMRDAVVARTLDGKVSKLDIKTGKILWVYAGTAPPLSLRGTSRPTQYRNLILVGNDYGKVFALDGNNGKKVWERIIAAPRGRTEIERLVDIDANLVVINDLLFVTTYQGKIAALHTETGRVIWTRDFSSYSGMALAGGKLYLTDSAGYVWSLDPRTGATVWKQGKLLRRFLVRPVVHEGYIVVADYNGFIHWLDRNTGRIVARTRFADEDAQDMDTVEDYVYDRKNNFLSAPMVRGNKMIVTTRYGYTALYTVKK